MGCSTPEAPDIQALADISGENAELAAAISLEQLDWAKDQFKQQMSVTNKVLNTQLPIMTQTHANAQKDRKRYEDIYQPLEDNLVAEFQTYDTKQRQNREAGEASADVTRTFDAQRENAARQLESYGIDPSQTRSQALDSNMRIQEAAAQASAQTNARRNVQTTGRALRAEALNIGKGYPSNVASSYGQALAAGNSAVGNINATSAVGASTMGTGQGWMGQSNQGVQTATGAMNTAYGNDIAAYSAQMELAGAAMGAVGGMAAEGGAIDGPGGPKQDAIPARLSDGEYVIPAEVMKRKGTEFFDKLIAKTRKDVGLPEEAPPRHVVTPQGSVKIYTDQDGQQTVAPGGIPMAAEGGSVVRTGNSCLDMDTGLFGPCPTSTPAPNDDNTISPFPDIPPPPSSGPSTDIREYIKQRGEFRAYKEDVSESLHDWAKGSGLNGKVTVTYNGKGGPQLPLATQQRISQLKSRTPGLLNRHGLDANSRTSAATVLDRSTGIPEQTGGA